MKHNERDATLTSLLGTEYSSTQQTSNLQESSQCGNCLGGLQIGISLYEHPVRLIVTPLS